MDLKAIPRRRKKQLLGILIIVSVISVIGIGAAIYARYIRNSNKSVNNFSPAQSIDPEVVETFDGSTKENVCFNVGDTSYPVYVRAYITFTWKEKDDNKGNLHFEKPVEGVDYTLDWNNTDWFYSDPSKGGDGFYYYKFPVKSNGTTSALINECKEIKTFVDTIQGIEYTLNVGITVQTVQAVGHTDENGGETLMSVEDAWSWTPVQESDNNGD